MKSIIRMYPGLFIFTIFLYHFAESLILPRTPKDICKNEDYRTPPSEAPRMGPLPVTCCSKEKLTPGISFEKFWNSCALPDESENMINVTLWRVYSCIVKKSLDDKLLTLENFATEMTKEYPEDKKKLIMDNINKNPVLFNDSDTELEKLMMIRSKYYNIELDSCSKNTSEIRKQIQETPAFYNKHYSRGGQCLDVDIPIDPNFHPLVEDNLLLQSWKTMLESVSVNDETTHGIQIQKACQLSSSWIAQNISTIDEMLNKPDLLELFQRVKPGWANKKFSKILETGVEGYLYWGENRTLADPYIEVEQAEKFYESGLKRELVGIKDEVKAKALFISCLIPTFMKVSMAESFNYKLCR